MTCAICFLKLLTVSRVTHVSDRPLHTLVPSQFRFVLYTRGDNNVILLVTAVIADMLEVYLLQ